MTLEEKLKFLISQLSPETLAVNLQQILDQSTDLAQRRKRFVWGERYYVTRQAETETVSRPERLLDTAIKQTRAFFERDS